MEVLGLFGILRKSSTIINANRKYFFKLAAALLLPLSLLSVFMSFRLGKIVQQLAFIYMNPQNSSSGSPEGWLRSNAQLTTSHMSACSSILIFLVKLVTVILSLVSTITFAQGVCRGYFDRKSTFKSSLSPVPKALRGLLLTAVSIWVVLVLFIIGVAILTILTVIPILLLNAVTVNPTVLLVCVSFVTLGVLVYLKITLSLAYVTSALEENWGWEAMRRSAYLVKGQRWRAFHVLLVFAILGSVVSPGVVYKFNEDSDGGISGRNLMKLLLAAIGLTLVQMYELATTTVFYIQCKIYHNESLDALPCLRSSCGEFDFANYMDLKSVNPAVLAEP